MPLPPRWYKLQYNAHQAALWASDARFRVVHSGRRSGKTELAKRHLVRQAIGAQKYPDARYAFAAPTHPQAKQIYWADAKLLVPPSLVVGKPNETELSIKLVNGATIHITGMDVPERIEGPPLDGVVLDEYGNMKSKTWGAHVRPALSTLGRPGWAWLIGVPEGRNHYYETAQRAKQLDMGEWECFHWPSWEVLDPAEIALAAEELDEVVYQQEYGGNFVDFAGRIYYAFEREVHANRRLKYDPRFDLIFCFDFNVEPGIAVVCQELPNPVEEGQPPISGVDAWFTAVIGEVCIPKASNTPMVCRKLAEDWGRHKGLVKCYGDATGGARGTAKVMGNDWEIIRETLKPTFGDRLSFRVPRANPLERVRVNAVNRRIRTMDGTVRMLVDRVKAPRTVADLEGVRAKEGTNGEIDKKKDPSLTHLSDGLGYYINREFSIGAVTGIEAEVIA